jgi:hypothetical protein
LLYLGVLLSCYGKFYADRVLGQALAPQSAKLSHVGDAVTLRTKDPSRRITTTSTLSLSHRFRETAIAVPSGENELDSQVILP